MEFNVTAALSRESLVYLTLCGVRSVWSVDRNVSKHAIISKKVVPYVEAKASQEKYGYLSGGNVQLCCFHGRKAATKHVQRLWNPQYLRSHHTCATGKTTLGGNGACMRVRFKGENGLSPEIWVSEQEIHQGQAEVGKMIPLLSFKVDGLTSRSTCTPCSHAYTRTLAGWCFPHTRHLLHVWSPNLQQKRVV